LRHADSDVKQNQSFSDQGKDYGRALRSRYALIERQKVRQAPGREEAGMEVVSRGGVCLIRRQIVGTRKFSKNNVSPIKRGIWCRQSRYWKSSSKSKGRKGKRRSFQRDGRLRTWGGTKGIPRPQKKNDGGDRRKFWSLTERRGKFQRRGVFDGAKKNTP